MIVCQRCGKENQDHYKFCLGCGAELTPPARHGGEKGHDVAMMKTMMADLGGQPAPTPPGGTGVEKPLPGMGAPPAARPPAAQGVASGQGVAGAQSASGAPQAITSSPSRPQPIMPSASRGPAPELAGEGSLGDTPGTNPGAGSSDLAAAPRSCPSCDNAVPAGFRFCGACGTRVDEEPVAAPRQTAELVREAATASHRGTLTLIRPDGSEGGVHALEEEETHIGRNHGTLFENDGYLSPTHAEIIINPGGAVVRDLDSLNGVFVKMVDEEELEPGQIIRIGQELLRFDLIEPPEPLEDGTEIMGSPNPGYWGKITVIIGNGVDGSAYPLLGDSVTLGRERGEINFPDDGYVSGLHARLAARDGKVFLSDLGSSNGTFIKVQGERELWHDSYVLLGQQLFRLDLTA